MRRKMRRMQRRSMRAFLLKRRARNPAFSSLSFLQFFFPRFRVFPCCFSYGDGGGSVGEIRRGKDRSVRACAADPAALAARRQDAPFARNSARNRIEKRRGIVVPFPKLSKALATVCTIAKSGNQDASPGSRGDTGMSGEASQPARREGRDAAVQMSGTPIREPAA